VNANSFIKRHPFLVLGIVTLGLFVATETMSDTAKGSGLGVIIINLFRVLIVPMWLMRTLEMLLGMGGWPMPLQLLVALPILFAPYVLADYLLQKVRGHGRGQSPSHTTPT
jgi:hypothetical protein